MRITIAAVKSDGTVDPTTTFNHDCGDLMRSTRTFSVVGRPLEVMLDCVHGAGSQVGFQLLYKGRDLLTGRRSPHIGKRVKLGGEGPLVIRQSYDGSPIMIEAGDTFRVRCFEQRTADLEVEDRGRSIVFRPEERDEDGVAVLRYGEVIFDVEVITVPPLRACPSEVREHASHPTGYEVVLAQMQQGSPRAHSVLIAAGVRQRIRRRSGRALL